MPARAEAATCLQAVGGLELLARRVGCRLVSLESRVLPRRLRQLRPEGAHLRYQNMAQAVQLWRSQSGAQLGSECICGHHGRRQPAGMAGTLCTG